MTRDKDFMAMALDLARLGLGRTSPNPAVGAVIVKKGKVIATGFHKRAGMPHAEIEAFSSPRLRHPSPASRRRGGGGEVWKGATLYVTLEPCCHHGRTPPCTDAIIRSGIKKVVIGIRDPDPKVSGKGIRILREQGIQVQVGLLRRECEELNEAYIKHRKKGIPFVILKVAATLDGMAASRKGEPRWISGPEARAFGHEIRDRVDGILVGIKTVLKDNPRLTTRLKRRKGRDPVRIILDSSLKIKPSAKVFRVKSNSPTWIATTVTPTHLHRTSLQILFCRRRSRGEVDLKDLLRQLGQRGIVTLLVEGGPTVWTSFLREKLADKIFLFLASMTLGRQGLPVYSNDKKVWQKELKKLSGISYRQLGRDLLIEGKFK